MTTLDLFFLYTLDDDLQNDLFHHFSRDRGDWPVVSQVLLALFEDGSNTGLPPVIKIPPILHDFSKTMESGLATASAHSAPVGESHQGPMVFYGC